MKEGKVEPRKCRKCGAYPHISMVDDCYYARCDKCTKWSPYEFLGVTPAAALRNWNDGNAPIAIKKKVLT